MSWLTENHRIMIATQLDTPWIGILDVKLRPQALKAKETGKRKIIQPVLFEPLYLLRGRKVPLLC